MKSTLIAAALIVASLVSAVVLTGCGSQVPNTPAGSEAVRELSGAPAPQTAASKPSADEEHGHKPGAHGGVIVSIGVDSYHAEAVVEKAGTRKQRRCGRRSRSKRGLHPARRLQAVKSGSTRDEAGSDKQTWIGRIRATRDRSYGDGGIGNFTRDLRVGVGNIRCERLGRV